MDERCAPLYGDAGDPIFLRAIRRKFAAGAAASAVGLQVFSDNDQLAWACAGVIGFCLVGWIALSIRLRRIRL